MLKIDIPKGFFDDKSSVTPTELLTMVSEMVRKVEQLQIDHDYEGELAFEMLEANRILKQRIAALEDEFKDLGLGGAL